MAKKSFYRKIIGIISGYDEVPRQKEEEIEVEFMLGYVSIIKNPISFSVMARGRGPEEVEIRDCVNNSGYDLIADRETGKAYIGKTEGEKFHAIIDLYQNPRSNVRRYNEIAMDDVSAIRNDSDIEIVDLVVELFSSH